MSKHVYDDDDDDDERNDVFRLTRRIICALYLTHIFVLYFLFDSACAVLRVLTLHSSLVVVVSLPTGYLEKYYTINFVSNVDIFIKIEIQRHRRRRRQKGKMKES